MNKITPIFKRRWFRVIALIAPVFILANTIVSIRIKNGIRSIATSPVDTTNSEVFRWVGPSTREAIRSVTQNDYKISVVPFDGFGESSFVTHTAFLTSRDKKIGIRIRAIPFRDRFDIVGYYTVQ